jgi:hypothetical protein
LCRKHKRYGISLIVQGKAHVRRGKLEVGSWKLGVVGKLAAPLP